MNPIQLIEMIEWTSRLLNAQLRNSGSDMADAIGLSVGEDEWCATRSTIPPRSREGIIAADFQSCLNPSLPPEGQRESPLGCFYLLIGKSRKFLVSCALR